MRILVVEGEPRMARVLRKGLEANHFAVDVAADGDEALNLASEVGYDALIVDASLPRLDGLTVVRRLRQSRNQVLVLMISRRHDVESIIRGLREGADDYLLRPFSFDELLARTNALLRRPRQLLDKLVVDDLEIDRVRSTVTRAGRPIKLSGREFAVLEYLVRNTERVVTRTMVVEHVWNLGYEGLTNIVDVYINYLRAKVDRGFATRLIQTVRGTGYMISASKSSNIQLPEPEQLMPRPGNGEDPEARSSSGKALAAIA